MSIEEPISDFNQFKKMLRDNNFNIFAEPDASFYIENSQYSAKHLPTEMHSYGVRMTLHCTAFKFDRSKWNRLAPRRDIVLQFNQYEKFSTNNSSSVLIKPDGVTFVEIFEECSNALYKVKLNYKPTWRNLYSDLHQAVCSVHSSAFDLRCKSSKLTCNVKSLLSEVRPLSFSWSYLRLRSFIY